MAVEVVIVMYHDDGKRVERLWKDLTKDERKAVSYALTRQFMTAAGYKEEQK